MADLKRLRSPETTRGLSPDEAFRLLEGSEQRLFEPGARIIRTGDRGDAMYVILEGAVEIRVAGDDGRVRFTTHLAEGDIFGEMAVLTDEPRIADVVAVGPCTCLVVDRASLEVKLRDHPVLAAFLTDILGKRMLESHTLRKVGKYHLVGMLGQGSMATVFEGFHREMNRPVAVKMLSHSLVYQTNMRQRFRNEARLLAGMRHENIVQVYDMEEAYRTYFIIMERLQGMDLERYSARHGPLPVEEVRWVLYQVARALAYAHDAGVVHRDIKPSNLFRLPDGTLRVVDFGIAIAAVGHVAAGETDVFCSPAYVAPEVVLGDNVDGRADIYSLGATAYRLLTGKPPYPYEETTRLLHAHVEEPFPDARLALPDLPDDLDELIRVCTQRPPEARFQCPGEIEELLAPRLMAHQNRRRCGVVIRIEYPRRDQARVADLLNRVRDEVRDSPRITLTFQGDE